MFVKVLNSWPRKIDLNTIYVVPLLFSFGESKEYVDGSNTYRCLHKVLVCFNSMDRRDYIKIGKIHCYHDIEDKTKRNILFSVGDTLEYYRNIKFLLDYKEVLYSLNDIALNDGLREKFIISKYARFGVSANPNILEKAIETIKYKKDNAIIYYLNKQLNLDLEFNCEKNRIYSNNIHAFIGRNGCGKTYLMNQMLLSLISSKSYKHGSFSYEGIRINKVLSVIMNNFDNDIVDENDRKKKIEFNLIRPNYFLQHFNDNDKKVISEDIYIESDDTKQTLENSEMSFEAYNYIKEMTKRKSDLLNNVLNLFKADYGFSASKFIEKYNKTNFSFNDTFGKLSNGHKRMFLSVLSIINEIDDNSLVFIDEPEANLYPGLISLYLKSIKLILREFSSVAFIFTHSPVLIQQLPQSCVWKITRNSSIFRVKNILFNSLGENIGKITRELFDIDLEDSVYNEYLENSKNDVAKNAELFGNEAKTILFRMVDEDE